MSFNAGINVNIELENWDEFADAMARVPKHFDKVMKEELKLVALQAERYARQLAPRDTGELENSIHAGAVKREGNTFVVYVGTNMEYAMYVHELISTRPTGDKYDKGVKIPNYYTWGRGKQTILKSNVKGLLPGRKYLRNAIVLTDLHIETAMKRAIERVFGEV